MEELQWVRHLYRKYGWPRDEWLKEEARVSLETFVHSAEMGDDNCWQPYD